MNDDSGLASCDEIERRFGTVHSVVLTPGGHVYSAIVGNERVHIYYHWQAGSYRVA